MNWTADRKHPDWEWTVGRVRHAICRGRAKGIAPPRLDPNIETSCGRCRSQIPNGARTFAIAAASGLSPRDSTVGSHLSTTLRLVLIALFGFLFVGCLA